MERMSGSLHSGSYEGGQLRGGQSGPYLGSYHRIRCDIALGPELPHHCQCCRHLSGLSEDHGAAFPGSEVFRGGAADTYSAGSYGSGDTGALHPPQHPAPSLNTMERGDLRYLGARNIGER